MTDINLTSTDSRDLFSSLQQKIKSDVCSITLSQSVAVYLLFSSIAMIVYYYRVLYRSMNTNTRNSRYLRAQNIMFI